MKLSIVALSVGCTDPTAGRTDEPTVPTTSSTSVVPTPPTIPPEPTTPPAYPQPALVQASCTAEENALRFMCAVHVQPAQPVQVTFAATSGGVARTHESSAVAEDHVVPLYFMEPDTEYTAVAAATSWPAGPQASEVVTTRVPPMTVRSQLLVTGTSSVPMIGTHQPCDNLAVAVIYSTSSGKLLWYQLLDANGTLGLQDMVQFTEDHTVLGETGGSVVEVDLTGREIYRLQQGVDYVEYLHHDVFKRNGLYYVMYAETFPATPTDLIVDALILFDGDRNEVTRWHGIDHLPVPKGASGDYLHTNTVWVEPNGDIVLSAFAHAAVLRLTGDPTDPAFGTLQWVLDGGGGAGELGQDFAIDWSPVDGYDAFFDQHSVMFRNDGRLMLLDNSHGRGLVLSVDEKLGHAVVDEAWDTAEDACVAQGTARDSLSGNAFVACRSPILREYDPTTADLVWSGELDCGGKAARYYPLDGW